MFRLTALPRRARVAIAAILGALLLTTAGACDSGSPSSSEREASSRAGSYDALVDSQPAETMNYSPTREALNGWITTWGSPDAVSYVYLQGQEGQLLGYFVLKGLPVSYCAALTPTYEQVDAGGTDAPNAIVPAPSVDGVYYSGGQCNTYFGFDASSGAYIEYTVGAGQNVLLYSQPLPQANNVPNLSPTA